MAHFKVPSMLDGSVSGSMCSGRAVPGPPVAVSRSNAPPVEIEHPQTRKFILEFQQRLGLPHGLEGGDERGALGLHLDTNNDLPIDRLVGILANHPGYQSQNPKLLKRRGWSLLSLSCFCSVAGRAVAFLDGPSLASSFTRK